MKFTSPIQGVKFRPKEIRQVIANLKKGEELSLEAEPTNNFDPYAIRILNADGDFLGYVEKGVAADIHKFIQHEHPLTISELDCTVTDVHNYASQPAVFVTIGLSGSDEEC